MEYKVMDMTLKDILLMYTYGRLDVETGDYIQPHSFDIPDECINDAIILCDRDDGKLPNVHEITYMGITPVGYGKTEYTCPVCNNGLRMNERYNDRFCPTCGQRIYWEGLVEARKK